MYNGEFEKAVQEKMEDLRLPPSEGMWQRIENELPTRRRRRFLWLLPLAASLVWTTWLLLDTPQQAATVTQQPGQSPRAVSIGKLVPATPHAAGGGQQQAIAVNDDPGRIQQPLQPLPGAAIGGRQQSSVCIDSLVSTSGVATYIQSAATASAALHHVGATSPATAPQLPKRLVHSRAGKMRMQVHAATPAVTDTAMDSGNEAVLLAVPDRAAVAIMQAYRLPITAVLLPDKRPVSASTPTRRLPDPQSFHHKPWTYGITFHAGVSNQSAPLNFSGDSRVNNAGVLVGPAVADSFSGIGIQTKPAVSFGAGLYIRRALGSRWALQAGLGYDYLSYTQRVGSAVDSIGNYTINGLRVGADRYYTLGNDQRYTNRLHLMQLPLELQYGMGKKRQWQLLAGTSVGYLLQSNALLYNKAQKTFLSGDGAYNQWLLSLHTGIGFRREGTFPFTAGIRFSYSLNSYLQKNINKQGLLTGNFFISLPLQKR